MKKFLFLSLLFGAIASTNSHAQSGNAPTGPQASKPQTSNTPPAYDPVAMLQQMKKVVPQMVEKTGLTEAQANRFIEISFEMRQQAGTALQGLNDADRSKKLAELKAEKEKKYSEIPLTAEQVKSVYAFYEELAKNTQKVN